ncbi:DUF2017 domain-containing protein [Streptomyces oceani]|uniref:Uncharacterized protein n=1 Tax=Streptomyces oceani TaxID=1075402 RepID=A0A1E7KG13_9ACTN|nr:DUF2017 domain-containing protein [Streptomyces oceani]OEV02858.1 hypothetical protein AN216_15765 [Streptomyces oceani]
MAAEFTATGDGGAAVPLDEVEISILRSLAVQLLELLGPGEEPAHGEDPLAALFTEGPSEPPSDPALARLLPDAYQGPDVDPGRVDEETHAASADFRRYTENDLRARKRADALVVVRKLDGLDVGAHGGAVLTLDGDESRQWLGALNDLRLAIGSRLEVTDEDDGGGLYALPDDDPRKPMVMAYLWLGALQETLIETLSV